MNEFKRAKEEYDNVPIPEELSERVRAGIREGEERYRARRRRSVRRWVATAACFSLLLAGLNLSRPWQRPPRRCLCWGDCSGC